MSLLTAIDSALSGLSAEATRLSAISNNVANSATVGFKKSSTEFESMVLAGSAGGASGSAGTTSVSRTDISTAGQIQSTGISTDIAVNGAGFMVVKDSATAGSGSYLVTRAGSFRPDASGNLVNSGGLYLQGQPLDAAGNLVGAAADSVNALTTVNVSYLSVDSEPTTKMTFTANLPAGDTAFAATAPVPSTTSVAYFDPLGVTRSLKFEFTPTQPASAASAPTNTWTMNIFDTGSATPAAPIGSSTMVFEATGTNAGTLKSVTPSLGSYDPTAGTFTVTTSSGATLPITIGSLDSAGGMTQLDGGYNTAKISKDGSGYGLLQGISVTGDGRVEASFTNGATRPIYQLDLAMFANPDGLTPVSGNAFSMSLGAGVPRLFQPGQGPAGSTQGGALEGSNVDLSTELTNLIETQRAYSSSATVVKTATEMLDVVNHLNG